MHVESGDPSLSAEVRALASAVAAIARVEPADLPAQQAVDDLRALTVLNEQLQVAMLERLRDMDRRQLHDLDALPSTGAWVEAQGTSLDRSAATLARRLDRLPGVRQGLASGLLCRSVAERVGRAVESIRGFLDRPDGRIDGQPGQQVLEAVILDGVCQLYGEALAGLPDDDLRLRRFRNDLAGIAALPVSQVERVEAAFVALAWRIERRLVPSALQRLVDALLPLQLEERTEQAHRDRALALVRHEDRPGGRVEGDLDAELFELLHTAVAAAMATDPENVDDTALAAERRAAGEEPYAPGPGQRPRSLLARRHDALAGILRDWLGSGIAGSRGKVVPSINVTVSLAALQGAPGALPAVGQSGATLAASLVRAWWCDSRVTRFVTSLGNRVLEMSHTERTLKAHERRAKLIETGGRCEASGCWHPPEAPLIPHHAHAWARTHTTSVSDTVLLGESCHDALHVGGKTLRLKDGRLLGPEGWVRQIAVA